MEHTESANKRIIWIDAAKFAAIMAVYLDHSFYSGMYYNKIILFLTYYHVSLFILLMGILIIFPILKYMRKIQK